MINIFVEKREEESAEFLTEINKVREKAKDAIGSIDYLLYSQLVNQLR